MRKCKLKLIVEQNFKLIFDSILKFVLKFVSNIELLS